MEVCRASGFREYRESQPLVELRLLRRFHWVSLILMELHRSWSGSFKEEIFFMYYNTLNVARVDIVAMHFDKEVIMWFQMLHKIETVNSWSDLTKAMEYQFGPSFYDCPIVDQFKLT